MRIDSNTVCPKCFEKLDFCGNDSKCINENCGAKYKNISSIPVLIDESNEVFNYDSLSNNSAPFFSNNSKFAILLKKIVPKISHNIASRKNIKFIFSQLLNNKPKVLIIGAGDGGDGTDLIYSYNHADIIRTDVYVSDNIDYICDAHSLPFESGLFDLVIIQAVLEHLLHPKSAVKEIHRVLNCDGVVYSEIPFMQQVHGGRYDFTRFTKSGHRQLFKNFVEIQSGQCGSVGMALSWSIEFFFKGIIPSKKIGNIFSIMLRFFTFPIKYFDYIALRNGNLSEDGSSATYFIGRKSDFELSDIEIIKYYKF